MIAVKSNLELTEKKLYGATLSPFEAPERALDEVEAFGMPENERASVSLNGAYLLTSGGDTLPDFADAFTADVPGTVQTALYKAGKIHAALSAYLQDLGEMLLRTVVDVQLHGCVGIKRLDYLQVYVGTCAALVIDGHTRALCRATVVGVLGVPVQVHKIVAHVVADCLLPRSLDMEASFLSVSGKVTVQIAQDNYFARIN